jgi:hypothetical protein
MRWREGDAGGEAWAFGFGSAGFIDEDEFVGDACIFEGIELKVEFLASG